jgi:hypothetical protein
MQQTTSACLASLYDWRPKPTEELVLELERTELIEGRVPLACQCQHCSRLTLPGRDWQDWNLDCFPPVLVWKLMAGSGPALASAAERLVVMVPALADVLVFGLVTEQWEFAWVQALLPASECAAIVPGLRAG